METQGLLAIAPPLSQRGAQQGGMSPAPIGCNYPLRTDSFPSSSLTLACLVSSCLRSPRVAAAEPGSDFHFCMAPTSSIVRIVILIVVSCSRRQDKYIIDLTHFGTLWALLGSLQQAAGLLSSVGSGPPLQKPAFIQGCCNTAYALWMFRSALLLQGHCVIFYWRGLQITVWLCSRQTSFQHLPVQNI